MNTCVEIFKAKWLVLYFSFCFSPSKTLLKAKVEKFSSYLKFQKSIILWKLLKSSISIVVNAQMCTQLQRPVRVTSFKSKAALVGGCSPGHPGIFWWWKTGKTEGTLHIDSTVLILKAGPLNTWILSGSLLTLKHRWYKSFI